MVLADDRLGDPRRNNDGSQPDSGVDHANDAEA